MKIKQRISNLATNQRYNNFFLELKDMSHIDIDIPKSNLNYLIIIYIIINIFRKNRKEKKAKNYR